MLSPSLNSLGSGSTSGLMKTSTPSTLGIKPITPPAIAPVHAPAPKGTVASHTVTDAAGNSTTTKYKTPTEPTKVAGSTTQGTTPGFIGDSSYTPKDPVSIQSNNQQAVSGLLNIGQGNNNSSGVNTAQTGLINSGNNAANIASDFGKEYADAGIAGANAAAGYRTTGTSPVGEGNAAVIGQTTAAKQSAISQGEQQALQGTSQQQGAYNSAGGLAQGQQGQNIGALGSAASQSSPTTQFGYLTNPQTGELINKNSADQAGIGGGIIQGKIAAANTQEQNYQQGIANLKSADNIGPQIATTLAANPTLNQTPISAITNLNQWLAGQTSDPAQQQLASQVSSYIKALGLTPDAAASIAVQKGGTIGTLLKTLRDSVQATNEGQNPANISGGSTDQTGSSTSGGSQWSF